MRLEIEMTSGWGQVEKNVITVTLGIPFLAMLFILFILNNSQYYLVSL